MLHGVLLPSSTSSSYSLSRAHPSSSCKSNSLPAAAQLLTVEAAKLMALLSNDYGSNGITEKLFFPAIRQQ